MNEYLGATVTYDFKPNTEVVDSSMISKWVKVDDDMNVNIDESAVKEYVQSLAASMIQREKKEHLHQQAVIPLRFRVEVTDGD